MEFLKSIANKHGLVCLLHEKPFAGVNGSGKHNNWSMSTDSGANLLEPGETPHENAQFLLFLSAVIKAVDEYQGLLRVSVASAGNDHRLGANEAPPAIISMFLGDELTDILEALESGNEYKEREKTQMTIGVTALPHFPKDTTDRNRTSPFAFTGNKFEFRMPGSAMSIADANITLNTIVAEALGGFADILENSGNFNDDLHAIVVDTIKNHKRIIFNGNNYAEEWVDEAAARGLLNLKTTVDACPALIEVQNVNLFVKHGVYVKTEINSRYEIQLENYSKTVHIEALTAIDMVKRDVIPSVVTYQAELAGLLEKKKTLGIECSLEEKLITNIARLGDCLYKKLDVLETSVLNVKNYPDALEMARYYRDAVFTDMACLRGVVDELETLVASKYWPYPSYGEILYSV
jgi:glutamine synthetase